jgi:hypothetical protein
MFVLQKFIEFTARMEGKDLVAAMGIYCYPQPDWIRKRPGNLRADFYTHFKHSIPWVMLNQYSVVA